MLDGLVITYVALLQFLRTRISCCSANGERTRHETQLHVLLLSEVGVLGLDVHRDLLVHTVEQILRQIGHAGSLITSTADPNKHYPLFDVAQAAQVETNLLAVGSLMVFIKTFKYISHLPVIKRLLDAVNATYSELLSYIAIFMVMMFAFAMSFHIAFGLHSADFAGVGITFITLMRFALGDVEIDHILGMNRILGTVLSLAYTFIMYLIFVGIGVSIL